MSIVITGASGKLGRLAAEAVAAKVSPSEATRRGYLAVVSSALESLTGRPPRSVRAVLEAHRSELAGAAA